VESVGIADLDANGLPDLVARGVRDGSRVIVLLNRGQNVFEESHASGSGVTEFVTVDANGDGILDLASIVYSFEGYQNLVVLSLGLGSGLFGDPTQVAQFDGTSYDGHDIAGADIDHDGYGDIVFCYSEFSFYAERNYVRTLRGDGSIEQKYLVSAKPLGLLVSDVDGDGFTDVAALTWSNAFPDYVSYVGATVMRNFGDGTLAARLVIDLDRGREQQASLPGAVEAVSIRPTGRPDLVVTDNGWTAVILNEQHQVYSSPLEVGRGTFVEAADLDGDQLEDLVLSSADSTTIWRSLGNGHFEDLGLYVGDSFLALADLDGDGLRDMALRAADNRASVRYGASGGTFGDLHPLAIDFQSETVLAFADVDGDGLADAFSGSYAPGDNFAVRFNLGHGVFSEPSYYSLPTEQFHNYWPGEVVVGDINGDGRRDIAALGNGFYHGCDCYATLYVLINQDGRTFTLTSQTYTLDPHDLHLVDLNHDGLRDIVTVNANGGLTFHFYVAESGSGGTLFPWERYRVEDLSTALGVGDLDGDGLSDIITYSPRNGSLVVTRNQSIVPSPTAITLALTSSRIEGNSVRLWWTGAVEHSAEIRLYRRERSGPWTARASLRAGSDGSLAFEDRTVVPGHSYAYRLGMTSAGVERFSPETWIDVPSLDGFTLSGARPNPATSDPWIEFALPAAGAARLEVLDVAGRRLHERRWERMDPGRHRVRLEGALRPGSISYA
jgi:hypothetical protein